MRKVLTSITATRDIERVDNPNMSKSIYSVDNIPSHSNKKQHQLNYFLTFYSADASTSHGSSIRIHNNNDNINLDMKRNNKNKIENNKDTIFKDNSHEYTLVTCKNQQSSQLISISSRIIPLSTPTVPNQTQVPSKETAQKLSHTQVTKQVT